MIVSATDWIGSARGSTVATTLCEWLAKELSCAELFTVPGEAFLPLLAHAGEYDITAIPARHESGAGFMALASAQLTGRPGVVAVNRAPGACNVTIAVDAAGAARVPMVVVVGDINHNTDPRVAFQPSDPRGMFGFRAEVITITPDRIHEQLHRARDVLRGPHVKPVVLVVAEDIWIQQVPSDVVTSVWPLRWSDNFAAVVTRVTGALCSAERPVFVLGDQIRRSRSDKRAHELARRLAAWGTVPVLLGNKQQDLLDNRAPAYAGHLHVGSPAALRQRLAKADLVVLLGQLPDEVCTSGWHRPSVIVVHPEVPSTTAEWWRTDARAVLDNLLEAGLPTGCVEQGWIEGWRRQEDSFAEATSTHYDDGIDLATIIAALDTELCRPATITLDAGNFSSWVHRYLRAGDDRWLLALENGAMGFGVPAAVAALRAQPDRAVIAVVGDGGLLMTGNELATAKAAGRCPVVIVADNSSYGTIHRHGLQQFPDRDCATALFTPDLVAWANAFGMPAERVEHAAGVLPAVRRALDAGTDGYLLHVRTSLAAGHANTVPATAIVPAPENI